MKIYFIRDFLTEIYLLFIKVSSQKKLLRSTTKIQNESLQKNANVLLVKTIFCLTKGIV